MRGCAVILAGGKSSRMKFDKQELLIGEVKLIDRNIELLGKIFPEVMVVTNKPELYSESGVTITTDIYPGHGPISGIHTALYHTSADFIYISACDMPNLNRDFIEFMLTEYDDEYDGILSLKGDYIEAMNAVYHSRLLPVVESQIQLEEYRIYDLVRKSNFQFIPEEVMKDYNTNGDMYYNINTVEDLKKYRHNEDR